MELPNELFKEVYWTFFEPVFENQNAFRDRLKEYHKGLGYKGKLPPIKWEEVCLESPKLVLQYVLFPKTEDEEITEPQILIEADNGKNFKPKELLFKMHNALVEVLKDEDYHFFEGLTFSTLEDPDYEGIPLYFVDLGS